eukprot:1161188-Pelagomonas_calceolata.AAC.12
MASLWFFHQRSGCNQSSKNKCHQYANLRLELHSTAVPFFVPRAMRVLMTDMIMANPVKAACDAKCKADQERMEAGAREQCLHTQEKVRSQWLHLLQCD